MLLRTPALLVLLFLSNACFALDSIGFTLQPSDEYGYTDINAEQPVSTTGMLAFAVGNMDYSYVSNEVDESASGTYVGLAYRHYKWFYNDEGSITTGLYAEGGLRLLNAELERTYFNGAAHETLDMSGIYPNFSVGMRIFHLGLSLNWQPKVKNATGKGAAAVGLWAGFHIN